MSEVVAGSSAARAGVRVDDRIVAVDDDRDPRHRRPSCTSCAGARPGPRTRVTLQRGKHRVVVTATLDDAATTSTTTPGGMAPLSLTVAGPG